MAAVPPSRGPNLADLPRPRVAIVDYGMGNLFSVNQACEHVGLSAIITASSEDILGAAAVILPGVGAFGDAMATLERLDLVSPLRDVASSQKPLIGICLGMQLMMTESQEFGRHRGLGIVGGEVVRLEVFDEGPRVFKVPQVGWNRIYPAAQNEPNGGPDQDPAWRPPLLQGLGHGEFMYFVHSFYPKPSDPGLIVATTRYGPIEFCSSLSFGNNFACQFHPERSGPAGLRMYRNLAELIDKGEPEQHHGPDARSEIRTA